MAITRAQQVRQMLKAGGGMLVSPSKDGKRPGYRFGDERDTRGFREKVDKQVADRRASENRVAAATNIKSMQKALGTKGSISEKQQEARDRLRDQREGTIDTIKENAREARNDKIAETLNLFVPTRRNLFNRSLIIPGAKKSITTQRKAYEDYLRSMGVIPSAELMDTDDLFAFFENQAFEEAPTVPGRTIKSYGDFLLDEFGNPTVKYRGDIGAYRRDMGIDDRGPDNLIFPPGTTPGDPNQDPDDGGDGGDDQNTQTGSGLALRFRKDGGRINAMDGGMMSPEGGIMDLETGRQMYFLGKLVKKATRAVKKITKSPLGKAALGIAALKFGPAFLKSEGLKKFFLTDPSKGFSLGNLFGKGLTTKGAMAGIAALSAAPLLFGQEEDDDEQEIDRGPSLDIARIRNNPYDFLGRAFVADGGMMRLGYQEGSKEPVAKKTMPLLDMGGKEMDLRDNGGFVPIGRMEKADDVPARLSKNEFVFTADAVRNAGEGDVDKGAEVMYNMMKNLEAGGEVSEESQGLEGAREMFQTSKRLEEVL
jgi:hypothetical protein